MNKQVVYGSRQNIKGDRNRARKRQREREERKEDSYLHQMSIAPMSKPHKLRSLSTYLVQYNFLCRIRSIVVSPFSVSSVRFISLLSFRRSGSLAFLFLLYTYCLYTFFFVFSLNFSFVCVSSIRRFMIYLDCVQPMDLFSSTKPFLNFSHVEHVKVFRVYRYRMTPPNLLTLSQLWLFFCAVAVALVRAIKLVHCFSYTHMHDNTYTNETAGRIA